MTPGGAALGPASPFGAEAALRAAGAVRERAGVDAAVEIAIVLGSGLGALADAIEEAEHIPFSGIPGFPDAGVVGHAGAMIIGRLEGMRVAALAGRFHIYEGHDPKLTALPVRVMHALGARTLIVSNAAGAVRRGLAPGDLMLIDDHINLMWRTPLAGPPEPGEERFPDMSGPYDGELRAIARDVARDAGIPLAEGTYCAVLGPSYETAAEIRMLGRLGADAVGMSTVPETLVARALGMRVLGISCITNLACGLTPSPISHAEVLEVTGRVGERLQRLVRGTLGRID
ncbi:MAG TPA: purine-nucleoside phosphorylase [Gemmatimonadaceae bacterium]|nr:purine-nucleoside phosphorylase [Gemmatimonadaceae bacterium]